MTDDLNLSLWAARRAEQGTLQAHSDYVVKQIAELEAKLAKAIEGLLEAENTPEPDHHVPQFRHIMDVIKVTLVDLEGK